MRIIPRLIATLRDTAAPREQREEALRFLVHFIGDMHQPLHAGERHDKGGNDVHVTFEGHPFNLHAAWDGKLIEAWFRHRSCGRARRPSSARPSARAPSTTGSGNRRPPRATTSTRRWTAANA